VALSVLRRFCVVVMMVSSGVGVKQTLGE